MALVGRTKMLIFLERRKAPVSVHSNGSNSELSQDTYRNQTILTRCSSKRGIWPHKESWISCLTSSLMKIFSIWRGICIRFTQVIIKCILITYERIVSTTTIVISKITRDSKTFHQATSEPILASTLTSKIAKGCSATSIENRSLVSQPPIILLTTTPPIIQEVVAKISQPLNTISQRRRRCTLCSRETASQCRTTQRYHLRIETTQEARKVILWVAKAHPCGKMSGWRLNLSSFPWTNRCQASLRLNYQIWLLTQKWPQTSACQARGLLGILAVRRTTVLAREAPYCRTYCQHCRWNKTWWMRKTRIMILRRPCRTSMRSSWSTIEWHTISTWTLREREKYSASSRRPSSTSSERDLIKLRRPSNWQYVKHPTCLDSKIIQACRWLYASSWIVS